MSKNEENLPATQTVGGAALPAYLQNKERENRIGNVDNTDLIIPRVKLLQAINPEVAVDKLPGASAGQFWHTILAEPLGEKLRATPILLRKSQVLWSPRNDDRGILARSSNGRDWDAGFENLEFEVKPKGSPHKITYCTGADVRSSHPKNMPGVSLADFGSSIPGDPNSAPALALTHTWLWYLHDFPDASPITIINTRSSIKPSKMLVTNLDMNPVDPYYRIFEIGTKDEQSDEGPYKGYTYRSIGFVEDEKLGAKLKEIHEQFKTVDWKANDEGEEQTSSGDGAAGDTAF